jgi:hypothetical protein
MLWRSWGHFSKPLLDGCKLFYVGGRGCVNVGDQMRKSFVTALREMHLVAGATHRALGRVASLHLVRGFDAVGGFRHFFWVENPYPSLDLLVVVLPDLAQYLDLSKLLEEF